MTASLSMRPCARLLMSSLVQAKCVNSKTCAREQDSLQLTLHAKGSRTEGAKRRHFWHQAALPSSVA